MQLYKINFRTIKYVPNEIHLNSNRDISARQML